MSGLRKAFFGGALTAMLLCSLPTGAHSQCSRSTADDWLTIANASGAAKELPLERVREVDRHLVDAASRLKRRSAVLLNDADLAAFTGSVVAPGKGLRAYLVRAIFPVQSPSIDVRWDGSQLDVFVGGLGCMAYRKRPIIVFLERQPDKVSVTASAAL